MNAPIEEFLAENVLDLPRECGDGDSGAECKETNPGSPVSGRSAEEGPMNVTREVQGAEKSKDNKKLSKIPVRQTRSRNVNARGKMSLEDPSTMIEIKGRQLSEDEEFALLEEAYLENEENDLKTISSDLKDIYADLVKFTLKQELTSTTDSLSPRAPLATMEEDQDSPTSGDFTMEEDVVILEAPEEFRGDLSSHDATNHDDSTETDTYSKDEIIIIRENTSNADGSNDISITEEQSETGDTDESLETERDDKARSTSGGGDCFTASTLRSTVCRNNSPVRIVDESPDAANRTVIEEHSFLRKEEQDSVEIRKVKDDIVERLENLSINAESLDAQLCGVIKEPSKNGASSLADVEGLLNADAVMVRAAMNEFPSTVTETISVDEKGGGAQCGGVISACATEAAAAAVAAVQASIESSDALGVQAAHSSRVSTVTVRAAPRNQPQTHVTRQTSEEGIHGATRLPPGALSWEFRGGRLVFTNHNNSNNCSSASDLIKSDSDKQNASVDEVDSCSSSEPLRSRDINKRCTEIGSRLKLLENKLKEAAGLVDVSTLKRDDDQRHKEELIKADIVLDRNENEVERSKQNESSEDDDPCLYPEIEITELGSPAELNAFLDDRFGGLCEFDVKRISAFSNFGADGQLFLVYDELDDEDETAEDFPVSATILESNSSSSADTMRGDNNTNEAEPKNKRHNPDHDNLKSLLKKPGRGKEKKNRVSFNENRNEFFDADYIILIREECDYDEDDDDGVCTCNQHEMVRLTCCEPGCNCGYDENVPVGATISGGPTPQSPKFAPPLEFVDSVTLSPPEGYKDMDLGEQQLIALQQMARHRQQHPAVCRECSGVHDSDSNSGSETEEQQYMEKAQESISSEEYQRTPSNAEQQEEREKTDQSQQTTPTTPPADLSTPVQSRYIMETITMTTVTERRLVREVEDTSPLDTSPSPSIQSAGGIGVGSPISGILKGGKLWKQPPGTETNTTGTTSNKITDNTQSSDASNSITSDEEGNTLTRRSVRFHESSPAKRDSCDGEAETHNASEEPPPKSGLHEENFDNTTQNAPKPTDTNCNTSVSPDATEMMLTFKLGHHVLISNNSLRPNSAVRQLFPCSKPLIGREEDGSVHQYLVTAESLKAFEEAKKSKLTNVVQDGDDSIRKIIERNTLRRSLIRYEPRSKKQIPKTDNSLVERIKQLTCDVDDPTPEEEIPPRCSPPGEESTAKETNINNRNHDKNNFSPSSSSTTSSNSSMSSTYKKITDLFNKREKIASDAQNNAINESNNKQSLLQTAPDLGNGSGGEFIEQNALAKVNPIEARKQFLSTLAPLTACVSGTGAVDEFQYQYQLAANPGERSSVASTAGTEYSLEDIDEALKNDGDDSKKVAPDVLVGTPSASESTDELAMFVQQDASRIERIKKRYQSETTTEEDDEHDDYGFNRRPSVRGIKPRFGTTTEILQQIQNQLQPPGNPPPTTQQRHPNHMWPYYSETGLDNPKTRACPQNYTQYSFPTDDKSRSMGYRPTSLIEENLYQNCQTQRCANTQLHYGVNHVHPPIMRIGGGCAELYQTLPKRAPSGRPESPPPMELSRSYHQTMVLIPYNRIEGFQSGNVSPNPLYSSPDQCNYARFANKKMVAAPVSKRYPEPIYHGTLPGRINHTHLEDPQYQLKIGQKHQMIRVPYTSGQPLQVHLMTSRSESPLPGQFATARATQTPTATLSTCNYYAPGPPNTRYRPAIGPVLPHNGTLWLQENPYASKMNRHSFPAGGPRYPMPDNISLADSDSQHSMQIPNGYRPPTIETTFPAQRESSAPASPTKSRFTERGVPEGAASVSPQDSTTTTSTMTSPTSPQNPPIPPATTTSNTTNAKSLYYAMNV